MATSSSPGHTRKSKVSMSGRSERNELEVAHEDCCHHKCRRGKSELWSGDEGDDDGENSPPQSIEPGTKRHPIQLCHYCKGKQKGRNISKEENDAEEGCLPGCGEESKDGDIKQKSGKSHGRVRDEDSPSEDDTHPCNPQNRCTKSVREHRVTKPKHESSKLNQKHKSVYCCECCAHHLGTSNPGNQSKPTGGTKPEARVPDWSPNGHYEEGNMVQYEGVIYVCIKGHASRPTWIPPKVINLWEPSGTSTAAADEGPDPLKLPYASELFGVYQPLVGWRSELSHERLSLAVANRVREAARYAKFVRQQTVPKLRAVDRTGTEFGRTMAAMASEGREESINTLLSDSNPKFKSTLQSIRTKSLRAEAPGPGSGPVFEPPDTTPNPARQEEAIMAEVLKKLNEDAPETVMQLFRPSVSRFERAIGAAKFLGSRHMASDVYLSPIGILHQFREYFFHLGTFLGPPVGHVWISPGSSVELVESNTRRRLVEQSMEQTLNTVSKSETSTTDKDELSDAVKVENTNDMRLGVSATASGGVGSVFHASGTASFNLDNSRKQAQEQTHKKMREQSAKLTNEVTQNFKTTFRTVTETTDTSSRRYVLQNQSSQLVSFELSRKMRKVGVQVQDLGQRLCFQLFIDNPGDPLGVGEFVHSVAEALDPSIKPAEEQLPPEPKPVTISNNFPYIVTSGDKELDDDFYPDPENWTGGLHHDPADVFGENDRIDFRREFQLPPAPSGYMLMKDSIKQVDFKGASVKFKTDFELNVEKSTYVIHLTYANFSNKEMLPFDVLVEYAPDQTTIDRVAEKNKKNEKAYDDQAAAAKEKSFYDTLRTRLKLSSQVRPRSFDVLREEERHAIYQRIIHRLYGHEEGFNANDYYPAAEMIRYLFDIDALLYFVAPDWWKPRTAYVPIPAKDTPIPASSSSPPIATRVSLMYKDVDAKVETRATYLMTEETEPAPLGASLGWIMQIDGDQHRNAFLNSPWVKAVLPIRPGRELEAIDFLQRKEVAGIEGLDEPYTGDGSLGPGSTLKDVLVEVAQEIKKEYDASLVLKPVGKNKVLNPGDRKPRMALPAEMVFARGYDPLEGGIDFANGAFEVFSEWTEILPTDQVVATEYPSRSASDS